MSPPHGQKIPRGARRAKVRPGVPLDIPQRQVAVEPWPRRGARTVTARLGDALEDQATDGAFWLLIDLEKRTATWRRAPYDPAPAPTRARALGLEHTGFPR